MTDYSDAAAEIKSRWDRGLCTCCDSVCQRCGKDYCLNAEPRRDLVTQDGDGYCGRCVMKYKRLTKLYVERYGRKP